MSAKNTSRDPAVHEQARWSQFTTRQRTLKWMLAIVAVDLFAFAYVFGNVQGPGWELVLLAPVHLVAAGCSLILTGYSLIHLLRTPYLSERDKTLWLLGFLATFGLTIPLYYFLEVFEDERHMLDEIDEATLHWSAAA